MKRYVYVLATSWVLSSIIFMFLGTKIDKFLYFDEDYKFEGRILTASSGLIKKEFNFDSDQLDSFLSSRKKDYFHTGDEYCVRFLPKSNSTGYVIVYCEGIFNDKVRFIKY